MSRAKCCLHHRLYKSHPNLNNKTLCCDFAEQCYCMSIRYRQLKHLSYSILISGSQLLHSYCNVLSSANMLKVKKVQPAEVIFKCSSTMAKELPSPHIQMGEYLLQFEEEELGHEFEDKAKNELRETSDVTQRAIATLKNILKDDEDLKFPVDDANMLLQFLRPCKFYPESAYEKMKKFYAFRYNNPKLYGQLLPSSIKIPILQDVLTVLPLRSQHGRRIFLVEVEHWNVKKVSLNDLFRCVMLLVEIAITEHRTMISGVDVIFDLAGLTISHVCQFTPSFASNALHWAQECVPLRLKAIHIVNQPYIFNMLFAIFKPFLTEKFRNRIYFHGKDYDSLLKHVDGKYLPSSIGGELNIPTFNRNDFYQLLCSYESRFEDRLAFGYKSKPT